MAQCEKINPYVDEGVCNAINATQRVSVACDGAEKAPKRLKDK
jgi:hypothetical protein